MSRHVVEAEYFRSKGLPYRIDTVDQMFSMMCLAGYLVAVVVKVQDNRDETNHRYYVGFHYPETAPDLAASMMRIRKYKVVHVGRFRGDPS